MGISKKRRELYKKKTSTRDNVFFNVHYHLHWKLYLVKMIIFVLEIRKIKTTMYGRCFSETCLAYLSRMWKLSLHPKMEMNFSNVINAFQKISIYWDFRSRCCGIFYGKTWKNAKNEIKSAALIGRSLFDYSKQIIEKDKLTLTKWIIHEMQNNITYPSCTQSIPHISLMK